MPILAKIDKALKPSKANFNAEKKYSISSPGVHDCMTASLEGKRFSEYAFGVVAVVTQYMAVTEEDLKGPMPDVVVWSGTHRQRYSVVHFTAKVLVQSLLMLHEYLNFSQF